MCFTDQVADINLDHMLKSPVVKASTDGLYQEGVKITSVLINNSFACCQKVLLF